MLKVLFGAVVSLALAIGLYVAVPTPDDDKPLRTPAVAVLSTLGNESDWSIKEDGTLYNTKAGTVITFNTLLGFPTGRATVYGCNRLNSDGWAPKDTFVVLDSDYNSRENRLIRESASKLATKVRQRIEGEYYKRMGLPCIPDQVGPPAQSIPGGIRGN